MITDFRIFSLPHLFGLVFPLLIGAWFISMGMRASENKRRMLNILFVCLLIAVRGSRYVMDIWVGRFDIFDLQVNRRAQNAATFHDSVESSLDFSGQNEAAEPFQEQN